MLPKPISAREFALLQTKARRHLMYRLKVRTECRTSERAPCRLDYKNDDMDLLGERSRGAAFTGTQSRAQVRCPAFVIVSQTTDVPSAKVV